MSLQEYYDIHIHICLWRERENSKSVFYTIGLEVDSQYIFALLLKLCYNRKFMRKSSRKRGEYLTREVL